MQMIRQITYGTGKYVHILCQIRLKDKNRAIDFNSIYLPDTEKLLDNTRQQLQGNKECIQCQVN